jgi:hypothetical protein
MRKHLACQDVGNLKPEEGFEGYLEHIAGASG